MKASWCRQNIAQTRRGISKTNHVLPIRVGSKLAVAMARRVYRQSYIPLMPRADSVKRVSNEMAYVSKFLTSALQRASFD